MTRYPKITITVEDENGGEIYKQYCTFFDIAMRHLLNGQDYWLKYLRETEDARKEEDLAQEPEVKGDK